MGIKQGLCFKFDLTFPLALIHPKPQQSSFLKLSNLLLLDQLKFKVSSKTKRFLPIFTQVIMVVHQNRHNTKDQC